MRGAGVVLAWVAGTTAAAWLLPPGADPFRDTLVSLPLLTGLFVLLERWVGLRGGRRLPAGMGRGEAAVLGALVLAVLGRAHLGLRFQEILVDRLLAAALVLLLAHRVGRQLVAMRPLLGRRLSSRVPGPFLLLPFSVYLAILPWSTGQRAPDGDEPYYLLLTHSLAYDLDTDLANNYAAEDYKAFLDRPLEPQQDDPRGRGGEIYSRHNVLLPLIMAPAYRLAGKHGALAVLCFFAALLAWTFLRLARHYFPRAPGAALLAYCVLAFTAPLILYSHQAWVEVPGALLAALALERILSLRKGGGGGVAWLQISLPLVLLPLLKLRFLLLAAPLLVLAIRRSDRRARGVLLRLGWALGGVTLAILAFNQWVYGNPLKYHEVNQFAPYLVSPLSYGRGFLGLFFDSGFGLFSAAPLWLLLLPALPHGFRRSPRWAGDLVLVGLPYLLALVPRGEWYGAWCPAFRYGIVLLPLLALGLVPLLEERRRAGARLLWSGLGLLTLALTAVWVAAPEWTYNLAHGRSHLLDHLSTLVGADVARFFPSWLRPRVANWIWPPLAFLVVPLLWWRPRRRLAGAAALGAVVALGAMGGILAAAHHVPTRVIEFEDPYLTKGGKIYPPLWVTGRVRFRGGWSLPFRARMEAPVVSGGDRLFLTLEVRKSRPAGIPPVVMVHAGEELLGKQILGRKADWQILEFEDLAWPKGARRLTFSLQPSPIRPNRSAALLDRAELRWE